MGRRVNVLDSPWATVQHSVPWPGALLEAYDKCLAAWERFGRTGKASLSFIQHDDTRCNDCNMPSVIRIYRSYRASKDRYMQIPYVINTTLSRDFDPANVLDV